MAIAYSIKDAAKEIGVSESLLRDEIKDGAVTPRYIRSKQIVEHSELERYVRTLPDERES